LFQIVGSFLAFTLLKIV